MKHDLSEWLVVSGYPSFELGGDGFPRPGQVLKHYRCSQVKDNRTTWKQTGLAHVLGVSTQAVRDMENRDIGFSIERRRFLAKLFDIPPVLLGIVTLEELLKQGAGEENRRERLHSSKKMLIDEQEYQAALQNYWSSHHSRAPHNATPDILRRIAILEATLSSVSGQQKIHRMEMLSEYHQLMGMILRDLQKFDDALTHLSHAVQFATYAEGNAELLAVSHYRRGVVALDKERVLHDKHALLVAHDVFSFALTLKKHIPLSLLNAVLLKGGHTYARVAKSDEGQLQGLKMMDQAGNIARNLTGQGHSYHFRTDVDHYHIDKGRSLLQ